MLTETRVRSIAREEADLAVKVSETNRLVGALVESNEALAGEFEGFKSDVDERFDKVDERFDKVDEQMDDIRKLLVKIAARLELDAG